MFLIPLCSTAFGQQIKYLDDGWFAIDRAYAERIATQSDSLREYIELYELHTSIIDDYEKVVDIQGGANDNLIKQLDVCKSQKADYEIIVSSMKLQITSLNDSRDFLTTTLIKHQKRAKKRKFWAVVGGVGGGFVIGVITGILIK